MTREQQQRRLEHQYPPLVFHSLSCLSVAPTPSFLSLSSSKMLVSSPQFPSLVSSAIVLPLTAVVVVVVVVVVVELTMSLD
jgi:hypothetical protein